MRVYVPASVGVLRSLVSDGRYPGPLDGCAVTPALHSWFGHEGDDDEPLEFAAQSRAADLSLALIAEDAVPRRLVLSVESSARVDPTVDELVGVAIDGGVMIGDVHALFIDDVVAVPSVRLALSALAAQAADDTTVPAEVESLDGHDLVWFAPEELPELVRSLTVAGDGP
jgi:hypothetical protein